MASCTVSTASTPCYVIPLSAKTGRKSREEHIRARKTEDRQQRVGSEDEGTSEEKVQLLLFSYGNANEVGESGADNGSYRQVERHHVNSFLPRSHLPSLLLTNKLSPRRLQRGRLHQRPPQPAVEVPEHSAADFPGPNFLLMMF